MPNTLSIKYPPTQLSTTLGHEYNAYSIAYCSVFTPMSCGWKLDLLCKLYID
jgi:hypothetical protein